jgi:hypothetical protein
VNEVDQSGSNDKLPDWPRQDCHTSPKDRSAIERETDNQQVIDLWQHKHLLMLLLCAVVDVVVHCCGFYFDFLIFSFQCQQV